jgi:hypothetical protein
MIDHYYITTNNRFILLYGSHKGNKLKGKTFRSSIYKQKRHDLW